MLEHFSATNQFNKFLASMPSKGKRSTSMKASWLEKKLHAISPLHVTAETGSGQCPTETEGQHSVNVDVNSESGNRVTAAAEAHYITTTKSLSSQLDVPATSLKSTTTGTPPTSPIDLKYTFISKEEYDSVMAHELEIERVPRETNTVIEGNRTVQLGYVLDWALRLQSEHSAKCTLGKMQVVEEVRRGLGLVSEIVLICDSCGFETRKRTEDPKLLTSHLNYGAVWGTLSTGSTYSQMEEQHSCMNIPCMPYNKFHAIELELGDSWKDSLWSTMEAAGKEEYERAVEKGQFDSDGNVWITVYVDGGWSHRSYGHNYNAASGAESAKRGTVGTSGLQGRLQRNGSCPAASLSTRVVNRCVAGPGKFCVKLNFARFLFFHANFVIYLPSNYELFAYLFKYAVSCRFGETLRLNFSSRLVLHEYCCKKRRLVLAANFLL